MKPEHWRQLDNLFHSALQREPGERTAFLDEACVGDDSLRKQVEALLAAHKDAGSFIESPALEVEARGAAADQGSARAGIVAGETVSHYRIISPLGSGGMGEVYLAEDTTLGRKVALKLLPADFTHDTNRVHRFQQEARAASALNHPNLITIHEIGQVDDRHFIATEFIDGETLRQRIAGVQSRTTAGGGKSGAPLPLREVLNIAIQTADALAAAHEAGIVHRDIKPENIMVRRRDGYIKVLDFGLAKLTEAAAGKVDTEAPTRARVQTSAGLVMGTVMYMSPEQARGQKVDARTDIWSLGVVLYELVAGRPAFEGSNTNEILALILSDKEPSPLARYAREAPSELERIVAKALRKNRDERYQTVKDLLLDLKSLKQRLEFEAELEHSTPPAVRDEAPIGGGQAAVGTKAELTPRTIPSAEYIRSSIRQHKGSFTVALTVLVLLTALGFGYWFYIHSAATVTQIESIAVLPFRNESGNPDVEYLSDGMTESLINSLSQLPNVRVMARTTMFSFKGKAIDPQAVGKQLSVDAVLLGKVVQRGDSLTIQTDLVKVSDGSQMWGEHYNRKTSDILAVQEDISREIVSKLQLRLSGDQEQRIAKRYAVNTEAYQLYLLGRFHWNKLTEEGLRKSIEYYNQAVAKDSNYALAYFGLSDAYALLGQIGFRPNEVYPKSLIYAEKALAMDPTLPEAHLTRGAYELWYGWNWTVAEQELKRAMELNTNLGGPHDLYGQFLSGMGRFDDAIAQNKRALELDPLSPLSTSNLGVVYYYARRYDLAIEQERKAMELDKNFFFAPLYIGWAYGQQGKYQEAIAELTKTRDLPGGFAPATSELGYVYAVSGRRTEAQKLLRELQERAKREFIDPYYIAIIHLGLGDQEQALAWLNKAYDERSFWLLWLKVEPKFDGLRADPRFRDLVRRFGLAP